MYHLQLQQMNSSLTAVGGWGVSVCLCVVLRDSPVVQGNSILALSGLAAVLAKYENNLPTDGNGSLGVRLGVTNETLRSVRGCKRVEHFVNVVLSLQAGPEFVPTARWLSMVLDTLLSIISSSYKASGQVFSWFLHVSFI